MKLKTVGNRLALIGGKLGIDTRTLLSITATTSKLSYELMENFDMNSLTVKAQYDDLRPPEIVPIEEVTVDGFDSSVVVTSQTLTITFGGKTASIDIAIRNTYIFDELTQTITGCNTYGSTVMNIPSQIRGYDVLNIGCNAFKNKSLTAITIPNTVLTIAESAFETNNITELTIPSSVISIGNRAFRSNKLTNISIPSSVTTFGSEIFRWNNLTTFEIPVTMTGIPNSIFAENKFTEITIPDWVTYIGPSAFAASPVLTSVTLPESVRTLDNNSFADCPLLTNIKIGTNVNMISSDSNWSTLWPFGPAFHTCYNTDNLKHGGEYVLDGTWSRVIPPFTGNYADYLVFNESTQTIVSYDTDGPRNLVIPDQINGIDVLHLGANSLRSPSAAYKLTSVTLPSTLLTIKDYALYDNLLTNITVPNRVTAIGIQSFAHNQLISVVLPPSVTFVNNSAFYNNAITSIEIGDNVYLNAADSNWNTSYPFGPAFHTRYNSYTLKSGGLYLFNTPEYPNAWVRVGHENESFYVINSDTNTITGYDILGGTNAVIPSSVAGRSVSIIGTSAMGALNPKLTTLVLPDTVHTLGSSAFYNNLITSVVMPESVRNVLSNALGLNPVTHIEIGSNVAINATVGSMGLYHTEFINAYTANSQAGGVYEYSEGVFTKIS